MLTKLVLKNWFQHRATTAAFSPGVNLLLGPNAAGKSNLLAGLAYAASGDAQLARGADPGTGDRAEASLSFVPPGSAAPAVLTRTVPRGGKGGGRRLTHGADSWNREEAVRERLREWWGCDPALLADAAFGWQGRFAEVCDAKDADRKRAVADLVGVAAAEAAWEALGSVRPPPPARDPAPLAAAVARLRADLDRAWDDLRALPEVGGGDVRRAAEGLEAASAAAAAYAAGQEARARLAAAEAEDARLRAEFEALRAEHAAHEAAHARGEAAAKDLEAFQVRRRRLELEGEIVALRKEAAAVAARVPPPPALPPVEPRLAELRTVAGYLRRLAALDPSCPCPTCGRRGGDLGDSVAAARADLAEYERLEAGRRMTEAGYAEVHALHAGAAAELRGLTSKTDRLAGELSSLPTPPEPLITEPEAWELAQGAAKALRLAHGCVEKMYAVNSRVTANALADRAAREAVAKAPAAPPDLPAARALLERLSAAHRARAQAEERAAALDRELSAAEAQLAEAGREAAAAAGGEAFYAACVRARAAVHRDAAPADAAADFLRAAGEAAGRWVADLGCGFRLAPEGGWYVADYGTRRVPLSALSGAEKLVVGVGWKAAVLHRVAPRFPLLALDEPTYGLEAAKLEALRRSVAAWPGEQLLVVTHDPRLADTADSVIRLGVH